MVPKTDAFHYTKLSNPVTVCHPDLESFITTATSGGSSECSTGINKVHTLITLLSVPVLLNDLVWNFSKNLY